MSTARKINESGKTIIVLTVIVGVFMFALNYMTPMMVDDYTYCYNFADGKKITSLFQIFPSMANHYQTMNGKVIVHGVFQLLLMLPQSVFDFLNAIMACLLCYAIYSYIWRMSHDEENAIIGDGILLSMVFDHAFKGTKGSWEKSITWFCRLLTAYICLFFLYQMVLLFR